MIPTDAHWLRTDYLSKDNACSVFSKQQYELAATKDVLIPALLIYWDIVLPTSIRPC